MPTPAGNANGGPRVEFVDAPERDPARDLLGRVGFAERVAATLAVQRETTSLVVGLYGPWGDGKTTLLRFIEARLHSDGRVLVVWFNPWFYKNEAQILEDFLEQIAEKLGIRLRKRRERVGKRVREVGQAVQGVNVGMGSVSAAGSVIGTVGGLLGEPTLRVLHDRLAGLLADQSAPGRAKRIVVLVDDIDRLDVEQIATVFRMIKLGADFPRISFLLALDPAVVAAALSQRYIGGDPRTGAAFLEKIVQVPLSVPKADPSRVAALMNQWLTGIMLEHCPQLPFEESARLQDAMNAWVWPQIATLRAGKRLLSTVQFVVPLMRGEVDPVDQVLLEALRILFPELYTFAAGNKLLLLRDSRGGPARAALQQGIDAALEGASEEASASGNGLLRELFPLLKASETNRWYSEDEIAGWARAKQVTSLSHFDRYFGYGLPVGDILDAEVDDVFTVDPVEAVERLTHLVQGGDLPLVLQKLIEQAHDRSAASSSAVAAALVGAKGMFDAPGDYSAAGRAARAGLLVAMLLRNLPPDQREQAAAEWLGAADVWFAAMCLNFFVSLSSHERQDESLLSVEALDRLGRGQAQRFAALPAADLFAADQIMAGLMVFGICYRYGSPEQIEELFASALEEDGQLLQGLLLSLNS